MAKEGTPRKRIDEFIHYEPLFSAHCFPKPFGKFLLAHIEAFGASDYSPEDRNHPLHQNPARIREVVERELASFIEGQKCYLLAQFGERPPDAPEEIPEHLQAAVTALQEAATARYYLNKGQTWEAAHHLMNLNINLNAAKWGRVILAGDGAITGGGQSRKRVTELVDALLDNLLELAVEKHKKPTAPKVWNLFQARHCIPSQALLFVFCDAKWVALLEHKRVRFAPRADWQAWIKRGKAGPSPFDLSVSKTTFLEHARSGLRERKEVGDKT